jgi:Tfp pilus assembly protein PilV
MRTFLRTTWGERGCCRAALGAASERLGSSRAHGEDGFLLIEVMISALLVAMIVVGTFNGLDSASRVTADSRRHNQATLLAAQSQEQLRTESAIALDALVGTPRTYTKAIGGTTYKITQEAKPIGSTGKTTGCTASSTSANTGANFQITSSVNWALLERTKPARPPVKQSSVITPPTGSAIEVDDVDGTGSPVSEVTARATFIPVESGSYTTVEGTTGPTGCVVLAGIQATSATVEILEKTGYVTPSGALKVAPKELSIAPTLTTHYQVEYAPGGRFAAEYTYEGKTSFEGKTVVSDTFVASAKEKMKVKPEYQVGSTAFSYEGTGEERYEALTGEYRTLAYTATGSKYPGPGGDLFDFTTPWIVNAGDCTANNINSEAQSTEPSAIVVRGATTTVKVPLSYTKLSIYKGTPATPEALTAESFGPVKITDESCKTAETPNNAFGAIRTHAQTKTLTEGRLENPFQPFGNFELCLVNSKVTGGKHYRVSYTNSKGSGTPTGKPTIYLGQRPNAEISSERAAKEAEYNTAKGKYTTENALYTADLAKYNTELSKYNTKKTEFTNKKAEYEKTLGQGGKKASQKFEYEKFEQEYKEAEKEYKKYETEYKTAQTNYKKYETEYKTAETAYKKAQTEEQEAQTAGVTVETGATC